MDTTGGRVCDRCGTVMHVVGTVNGIAFTWECNNPECPGNRVRILKACLPYCPHCGKEL